KPDVHPRRIELHLCIDERLDAGEVDDLVEVLRRLLARETENRRIEKHVLAAGEVAVEAGAELQEGGKAAATLHETLGGRENAADQLEQRRLARPVGTDQAE